MITLKQLIESVGFDTMIITIETYNKDNLCNDFIMEFAGDENRNYMMEQTEKYWNYKVNYIRSHIDYGRDCLTIEVLK